MVDHPLPIRSGLHARHVDKHGFVAKVASERVDETTGIRLRVGSVVRDEDTRIVQGSELHRR